MHSTSADAMAPTKARKRNPVAPTRPAASQAKRSPHGHQTPSPRPPITTVPRSSLLGMVAAQAVLGGILRQAYEAGALTNDPVARRAIARGIAEANADGRQQQIYRAAFESWLAVKHPLMFPAPTDHDSLPGLVQACEVIAHRLQIGADPGLSMIRQEIESLVAGLRERGPAAEAD